MQHLAGKSLSLLAICAAAATLTVACTANQPGQAQSAANAGRRCFLPQQVNGFDALDRDTVLVTIGARTTYQLDILGTCPEINWSNQIGIRSTGGGSWICEGMDAELLVPSPSGLQRCPVLGVKQLTPDEAKAARQKGG